jgi:hypothetical protein
MAAKRKADDSSELFPRDDSLSDSRNPVKDSRDFEHRRAYFVHHYTTYKNRSLSLRERSNAFEDLQKELDDAQMQQVANDTLQTAAALRSVKERIKKAFDLSGPTIEADISEQNKLHMHLKMIKVS